MGIATQRSDVIKNIETTPLASIESSLFSQLEGYRLFLMCALLLIQTTLFVPFILLLSSFVDLGLTGVSVGVLAAGTVGVLVTNMGEASIKTILIIFLLSTISNLALIGIHLFAL